MNIPFQSRFSIYMEDMILFKEALGYARSSYEKFLLHFDRFCLSYYPGKEVLTKELVMEWAIVHPDENANGLKRRMIALREFGKYLNSVGVDAYTIPSNLIGSFKPYTPYVFTDDELSAFFMASDNISPHKLSPYRQYIVPVVFRLMYCCGLRPREVRLIRCSDIDIENGSIYVRNTKMHKDRIVAMSPDMVALCSKYESKLNRIVENRDFFFQHPDGTAYSAFWLQNQFWKCWQDAGIHSFHGNTKPRVSDFRHNYATRIMMKWVDERRDLYAWLPYLSTYMGHSAFSETAYYIHLLPKHLMESSSIDWAKFSDLIPEVGK